MFTILLMITSVVRSFSTFSLHRLPFKTASFHKRCVKMSSTLSGNLVSVQDCIAAHEINGGKGTVFVDGSWHLSPDRNGREEYEVGPRITGAKFFDIDDVAAKGSELNPKGLPHMMPPKELFARVMDELDIESSNNIVVYGTAGCMFTSRAWYMIRAMGHPSDKIHLMQGSLVDWEASGGPVETVGTQAIKVDDLDYSKDMTYVSEDPESVVDISDVMKVVSSGIKDSNAIIIDARGASRFRAEVPEPRPGVRGGHMPGSYNVPFAHLLDDGNVSKLRSEMELKGIFEKAGVDIDTDKRIICSCGSGVTACVVALALEECGRKPSNTFIYDGSWIEWGMDPETPIV